MGHAEEGASGQTKQPGKFTSELRSGDNRTLGRFDLLLPLAQNRKTLFFSDIRFIDVSGSGMEGNLGFGLRQIRPNLVFSGGNWMWGAYVFADRRRTADRNYFSQFTIGAELSNKYWSLRGNAYFPDRKTITLATAGGNGGGGITLQGTTVVQESGGLLTATERALPGFDTEAGIRFETIKNQALWLYGGYFRFERSGTPKIDGPRGRLEYRMQDLFDWTGSELTLGGEIKNDDINGTRGLALVRFSIPFGPGRKTKRTGLDRRMTEFVQRDVDVVTFAQDINAPAGSLLGPKVERSAGARIVTDPETGEPLNVYIVSNGGTGNCTQSAPCTPATAQSDALYGAGDVIVLVDAAGNVQGDVDLTTSVAGQGTARRQLVGGNGDILLNLSSGDTMNLTGLGGRPTLAGSVQLSEDALIFGFDINAPGTAIASNGVTSASIRDLNITGAGNHGIHIQNTSTALLISELNIQNVGGSAFFFEGVTGPVTVGNTTIANSAQGIQINNSTGPFTFGNVSIDNATSGGIDLSGASGAVVFNDLDLTNLGGGTGLSLNASSAIVTMNTLDIIGTGAAGSRGVDMRGATGSLTVTNAGAIQNVVTGLDFDATSNAPLSFQNGSISTTGGSAINAFGGNLNIVLNRIDATGGTNGLNLVNTTGSLTINGGTTLGDGGTLSGSNAAINLSGGSLALTLNDVQIQNYGVDGIRVDNNTGSFIFADGQIDGAGSTGDGIQITAGAAGTTSVAIAGTAFNNIASDAIDIDGTTSTQVTNSIFNTVGGDGLNISGTSGAIILGDIEARGGGVTGSTLSTTGNTGSITVTNGLTDGILDIARLDLTNETGPIALTNVRMSNMNLTGGAAEITLNNATLTGNTGGFVLNVDGITGGFLNFTGTSSITQNGGSGVRINNVAGNLDFNGASLDIDNTLTGIDIQNSSGTFNFNNADIANTTGTAFNVTGGTANITYNGNITQGNNASAVSIAGGHSTGTITFQNGIVSATNGSGLQFDNANGIYNFNGTTTLNGGDAGIDILNGSGGAFTFGNVTVNGGALAGPAINLAGATNTVNFNDVDITNLGGVTGLNLNGSSATVTMNTLDITGIGAAASTGVDMRGASGALNVTNAGIIQNVVTGFDFDAASNATLTFQNGTLNAGIPVNTVGVTNGIYDFTGSTITKDNNLATATGFGGSFFFIDATGSGTGTASSRASADFVETNSAAGDMLFLVNDGTGNIIATNGLQLQTNQQLLGFASGNATVDFTGANPQFLGTFLYTVNDPTGNGAATLSNSGGTETVTLSSGVQIRDFTITTNGAVDAIGGNGFNSANISNININGAGDNGLNFVNTSGNITVSNSSFNNSTGAGLRINGGNATVNFVNTTISDMAIGRSLDIQGTTGGSVTFDATSNITNSGGSGLFMDKLGGNITFNNPVNISGAISAGITATNLGTATVAFNTPLSLSTASGSGLVTSGGTLNINGGSINATGGSAIDANGGSLNIVLERIDASGGINGLNLLNTAGTLTINGGATLGDGGILSGSTSAINLSGGSLALTLNDLQIQNYGVDGIRVDNNTGSFIFSDGQIDGTGSTGDGIRITAGASGTTSVAIAGSAFNNIATDGIDIDSTTSTQITNSTFNTVGGDGVNISGTSGAIILGDVEARGGGVTGSTVSTTGNTGNITITNGLTDGVLDMARLDLTNETGPIALTNVLMSNMNVTGGAAEITLNNATLTGNAGGFVLNVDGTTGGFLNFTGTSSITQNGGSGVRINNAAGNLDFNGASLDIDNTLTGIDIQNSSGTYNFSNADITNTTGIAFNVTGGTANITYNGNITQSNNTSAVSITGGHNTGTVTFQNGTISATNGNGLQFDNADGIYSFNSTTTLNGGDAGIDILNGSAGTFTFGNIPVNGAGLTGPAINLAGATNTVNFNDVDITNLGGMTGLSLNGSSATVTMNTLNITGTGAIDSTGVDMRGATGALNVTNAGTIQNVLTGFDFDAASNAALTFQNGTINTGIPVNTVGVSNGTYDFTGSTITKDNNLATATGFGGSFFFIDATGSGIGTASNPASANFAETNTIAGDILFLVNDGTGDIIATNGLQLQTNQQLLGFASGNTAIDFTGVNPQFLGTFLYTVNDPTGNGAATLSNSGGTETLTLADGVQVRDFTITTNGAVDGIGGNGFNDASISNINISGAGANSLNFVNASGNINITNSSFSNSSATGLRINGGTAQLTLDNTTLSGAGALVLDVDSTTGGFLNFTGTSRIIQNGGSGIRINNAASNLDFSGTLLDINNTTTGIDIRNSSGTYNFSNADIAGTSSTAFSVDAGSANVTYNGAITNSAGRSVSLSGRSSGTISFNGAITDSGQGILIQNNTGGQTNFNGLLNLDTTTNTAIQLNTNVGHTTTFSDIDIDTTSGSGFVAINGGTVTISGTTTLDITAGGTALSSSNTVFGGSGLAWTSLSATGASANSGLVLNGNTGNFSITGTTTISDRTVASIDIDGTGNTTLGTTNISNRGAGGIDIDGTSGTLIFGASTITGTGGSSAGIDFSGATGGSLTFASSTITNSGGAGIVLNNNAGTFTSNGGSITTASGTGIDINQGAADVTIAASVDNTAGRAISVTNRTGGTVALNGAIVDTGATGLLIQNNSSGSPSVSFGGTVDITNTTGTAVTVTGNTGGTVSFSDLDITNTTSNQTGLFASNTGRLNIDTGRIDTGSARAVDIDNTLLGNTLNTAAGLTLFSVNSNGGSAPGIDLDTTTGAFTVTGSGSGDCKNNAGQCSGGNISNMSGGVNGVDGILLNNANNVNLNFMLINNNSRNGIFGTNVNGFGFNQLRITNSGDQVSPDEAGILMIDAIGSASGGNNPTSITNTLVSNSYENDVIIRNNSGTLTDLVVTASNFTNNGASTFAGSQFLLDVGGTANVTATMNNNTITGNTTAGQRTAFGIIGDAADASQLTLNVSSSNFTNNNVALSASVSQSAVLTFNFLNNTITGSRSNAINVFANASHTNLITGTIQGNTIGTNGVLSSGSQIGSGIRGTNEGSGTLTLLIDNNLIREIGNGAFSGFEGIFINNNVNPGTMNATITNNTLDQIRDDRGINTQMIVNGTTCANISGNTLTNIGGSDDLRVRRTNGTFNLTQSSVANLGTVNNGATATSSGTINFNAGPCATP